MKDKLGFIQIVPYGTTKVSAYTGLSSEEIKYWKSILSKTIKVATEFEYNLPPVYHNYCMLVNNAQNKKDTCWCSKLVDNQCDPKCVIEECEHKDQETCNKSMCIKFTSQCLDCKEFKVNCVTCSKNYSKSSGTDHRARIKSLLQPKDSVAHARGVNQVIKDGSLIGDEGVEVTTIAQFPEYDELYKDYRNIMEVVSKNGGWVNERCSIHTHFMTQYLPNGGSSKKGLPGGETKVAYNSLEKPIPNEICINFHQLIRRFEHALEWMFSTGNSMGHLTRWEKFRQSILAVASPVISDMREVNNNLMEFCRQKVKKEKYSTFNYFYSKFNNDGEFTVFHVESRFADGSFCPSAIASLGCLLFALLLKAVDISRYGILSIGSSDTIARIHEMRSALVNNNKDYHTFRASQTQGITKHIEGFKEDATELVYLLEPYLSKMGNAMPVLLSLAEKPVSIRRALYNLSWDEINEEIDPDWKISKPVVANNTERTLLEAIDMGHLFNATSTTDWLADCALYTGVNDLDLRCNLVRLVREGIIKWSPHTKTYIRV